MNKKLAHLLLVTICSFWVLIVNANEVISYQLENNILQLKTKHWPLTLRIPNEGSVFVHRETGREPVGGFVLAEQTPSLAPTILEDKHKISLILGKTQVVIDKHSGLLSFYYNQSLKLQESTLPTSTTRQTSMSFKLTADEELFAGGERILGMDRRGLTLPLYNNGAYGYQDYYEQMYFSVPGYLSSEKYYLMFDNAGKGQLDLGATVKDKMVFTSTNQRLAYLVSMADSFQGAIKNYTASSGRQPLPPRWSFGHIASRFGYRSEQQARETLGLFKKHQIPVDGIVFDIYWFGPDVKGHMGKLSWDRDAFPNPEQMISDFKQDGINTVLISEPFILSATDNWKKASEQNVLVTDGAGKVEMFESFFGNGSLVDIFNNDSRDWFWQHYKKQLDMGVSGFWADLGEPEHHPVTSLHRLADGEETATAEQVHNIYSLEWAKLMYQGFRSYKPNDRPFILIRSGYAGSQRYGVIPWTGDVSRTWKGLHAQTELILQMGMMGFGYTHSDIGGFLSAEKLNPELYKRWLQIGAFHPVFRPHAHDSVAPEAIYHGPDVINNAQQVLQWRYELLPYNYSLAFQNHNAGLPLVRPVFFHDENYDKTSTDVYLWGPNLLVKPITKPGVSKAQITLPAGKWFNYWTDEIFISGTHEIRVETDRVPVFVRAGSVVPKTKVANNTKSFDIKDVTLHFYYDRDATLSEFEFYLDDGSTMQYQDGDFKKLKFRFETGVLNSSLQLQSSVNSKQQLTDQTFNMVVHHCVDGLQMLIKDTALKLTKLENNQCQVTLPYTWGTNLELNIMQPQ